MLFCLWVFRVDENIASYSLNLQGLLILNGPPTSPHPSAFTAATAVNDEPGFPYTAGTAANDEPGIPSTAGTGVNDEPGFPSTTTKAVNDEPRQLLLPW